MEKLDKLTPTQLLKYANDIKSQHESLKQEIFDYTNEIDRLTKIINDKLDELKSIENDYVSIVEEIDKR